MKSKGLSIALLAALSLSGCLEATKVAPVPAPVEDQQPVNSVLLSLPRTALTELGANADSLVIKAFKVENGILGAELRDAYKFPVTDAGLYSLDGLPVGELELQVALLDEKNQALAEAFLRTVINPGSQTLPPLTLRPHNPTTIDLNFSFALQLLNFPDAPVTIPAEPPAMRTLLQTYRCQSCHNSGARPFAGLDLQSYPYKNTAGESLAQILSTLIKSFTGSDGVPKMPPSNMLVKDEDAAIVRNFLQTVNEANSADKQQWVQDVRLSLDLGESERFESTLTLQDGVYIPSNRIRVVAGSKYTYSLTIYGPGGSRLYEVIDGALEVPVDGKVQLKAALDYKTSGSTLPVIVGQ